MPLHLQRPQHHIDSSSPLAGALAPDGPAWLALISPVQEACVFKRKAAPPDIALQVERLQVEALQCSIPGDAAAPFNRAGDILLAAGDVAGAIESYGRAVDSYIEADRVEAAMALCRKIIRTVPEVVRARCTLTWLVIGAGYTAEAIQCAAQYATIAEYCGRERYARQHVRHMSEVADQHALRLVLGECLLQLGDDHAADEVLGAVYREQNTGIGRGRAAAEVWPRVRAAALLGPDVRPGAG
jgi:hypothetical protein